MNVPTLYGTEWRVVIEYKDGAIFNVYQKSFSPVIAALVACSGIGVPDQKIVKLTVTPKDPTGANQNGQKTIKTPNTN